MMDKRYHEQVHLLLRVLPFVAPETCFALKGGTAINLFVRDMPRLSVDIDLTYVPIDSREQALAASTEALDRIAARLERYLPGVHCVKSYRNKADALRMVVRHAGISVKIELSPVLRGTLAAPSLRTVTPQVEAAYGFAEMPVLSQAELYAGKLCAALDRQHPRDFFDVMLLLDNESIDETLREAFVVYLLSHPRPPEELLAPNWRPMESVFQNEFRGMTAVETSAGALQAAAQTALKQLKQGFTREEQEFILSFYRQTPAWDRLPFDRLDELPALRWKQRNIDNMSASRRHNALQKLEQALDPARPLVADSPGSTGEST